MGFQSRALKAAACSCRESATESREFDLAVEVQPSVLAAGHNEGDK
jgi:hypothetical protein